MGKRTLRSASTSEKRKKGEYRWELVPSFYFAIAVKKRKVSFLISRQRGGGLDLDEDGRIEPYVDFTPFYRLIEQIEQGRVEEGSSNPGNAELTNGHLSSGDSIPNTPEADGFVWVPQSPKDDLSQA